MTLSAAPQTIAGYHDTDTGKVHTGQRMGIGNNVAWHPYWAVERPFINLVKGASIVAGAYSPNPGGVDANGYPDISAGGSYQMLTVGDGSWMQTGVYILRWTGTAAVSWNGGTEINPGTANRREYNVTVDVPSSNKIIFVTGPGTCTGLELLAPGDETRYDAGNILNSLMLSDLAGTTSIRTMNWSAVNESAPQVDAADFCPYDWITYYSGDNTVDHPYIFDASIQAHAQAANELGCNLYLTIPYQVTDAACTALANIVNANLTGDCYLEYSNENWNTEYRQSNWLAYSDAPLYNTTAFDFTTVITTLAGHGLVTGDEIICHETMTNWREQDWPYNKSSQVLAIVDDANTFRITDYQPNSIQNQQPKNITNITQANPAVVTVPNYNFADGTRVNISNVAGMTEINDTTDYIITVIDGNTFSVPVNSTGFTPYSSGGLALQDAIASGVKPPTSRVTELRYRLLSESSKSKTTNYGERMVEVWALFKAVLGPKMVAIVGGASFSDEAATQWTGAVMQVAGVRENFDYVALGQYTGATAKDMDRNIPPYPTFPPWQSATPAEITEACIELTYPTSTLPRFVANLAEVGTYRMMNYETGEHHGPYLLDDLTNAELWQADVAAFDLYDWLWPMLADLGHFESVHFHHARQTTASLNNSQRTGGSFGMMLHLGDTTAQKYMATKKYMDQGGAPKT